MHSDLPCTGLIIIPFAPRRLFFWSTNTLLLPQGLCTYYFFCLQSCFSRSPYNIEVLLVILNSTPSSIERPSNHIVSTKLYLKPLKRDSTPCRYWELASLTSLSPWIIGFLIINQSGLYVHTLHMCLFFSFTSGVGNAWPTGCIRPEKSFDLDLPRY